MWQVSCHTSLIRYLGIALAYPTILLRTLGNEGLNVLQLMSTIKATLRRQLLAQREAIPLEVWQKKSQEICHLLQATTWLQESKTVLAYFWTKQEPDLTPLFSLNYQWGFPRCVGKSLEWHLWQPGDPLEKGPYGILEPSSKAPILTSNMVDLILLPAISCDQQGYRLGYGGGFYDRLLAEPVWSSVRSMGITFDFALQQELPHQEWDQRLKAICTESRIIYVPSEQASSLLKQETTLNS